MADYFKSVLADPALARSYILLMRTIADLERAGDPRVIHWRRIFDGLLNDYRRISGQAPVIADEAIRSRIRATSVRPTTSQRMERAIVSRRFITGVEATFPSASFGIADLNVLNEATMRPGARKPYWRAQEYGYEGNVGRIVPGYFEDSAGNQFAPNQAQFREHPYFVAQRGKGTPAMVIGRAIEARHFLRDGSRETLAWLDRETNRAQQRVITAAGRIPRGSRP